VKLTIVGCSGSFPGPDSATSCYLVEAEGVTLVLDLGPGALGPLSRYTDIYGIGAVLLSHLHADHCFDVCSLYVARRYLPGGPAKGNPQVYGPRGTADRLARAYDLPVDPGMTRVFDFREWDTSTSYDIGPFHVRVVRVNHPIEAYGMRIEHGGRSLVYSGDTGVSPALVELARGANLLLCEAAFHDGRDAVRDVHLSGREAAEHATAAGVERLVLTHLPPWNDPIRSLAEAAPVFTGECQVARPGASYDL
jgi:ribonuclease BN (tRNA processing enzyme)